MTLMDEVGSWDTDIGLQVLSVGFTILIWMCTYSLLPSSGRFQC